MTISKKITTAALLAMSTTSAFASTKTDASFDKLLKTYKVAPMDEQAYCYTDEKGVLQGKNVDLEIRLASVTKLLTSLWALEEKGVNYRYDTKLFIKGKNLHLQGSFDPFMSNEKMLFLVSQLNTLGYTHFDKITYDKNIQINPVAQFHTNEYPLITRDSNGRNIRTYFNTDSWSKVFKAEYDRLASLAKKDRFVKEVNFSVDTVEYIDSNPLEGEDVKVLTLTSPELYKYLKETNVKSNNYSAHTIFRDLGGEVGFERFLAERYSLTADQIKLFNGSGLPSNVDGKRVDNYATCAIVTNLISELKSSAERQQKELEDIVAVPGNDQGTFRNRLNSSDLRNTFVAKTGTLMHTSTLAGAMSTQKGFSFFGVFNQTSDVYGAKAVQNEMVRVLLAEMGGPKVFGYQVEGFHAYDNNENVKNFDLDQQADDFTSIEGNLQ
jgi:D-alanyl-D-alanine carboxypeptidase/D-alanyl-D-alanine-endopeptidase (penicillin-binding protein 4)